MKKLFLVPILAVMFVCGFAGAALCAMNEECTAREAELLEQIAHPRHATNKREVQLLRRELQQLRANCSDENQRARAEMRINESRAHVTELQLQLDDARANGKLKQVLEIETRLQTAYSELEAARAKLARLQ
jgi:Protein of unknown function (DUF1090).